MLRSDLFFLGILLLFIFDFGLISSAPIVCNIPVSFNLGHCVQAKDCSSIHISSEFTHPDDFEEYIKRRESCEHAGQNTVCCELTKYVETTARTMMMTTSSVLTTKLQTTTSKITTTSIRSTTNTTEPPNKEFSYSAPNELQISTHASITNLSDISSHRNFNLFDLNTCGKSSSKRVGNGKNAGLLVHPWTARIGYRYKNSITYNCGGTLISKYYVLTAAHCVTHLSTGYELKRVRLGEYDETTERDCDDDGSCADPIQDINIQETIHHPEFSLKTLHHDIALIRLAEPAKIKQNNIKPICLPLKKDAKRLTEKLYVLGWGATTNSSAFPILQIAALTPVSLRECENKFSSQKIKIIEKQMCAVGMGKVDACKGDSGGPLVSFALLSAIPSFVQYGITSFGVRSCGVLEDYPGIYTNVPEYLNWILDNMH